MAEKSARVQQAKQATSLLLSPPGSGFSFDASGSNALLLPVSQVDSSLLAEGFDGEADSFVGQQPVGDPKPFTYFQAPPSANENGPDPFSQLNKPKTFPPTAAPTKTVNNQISPENIIPNPVGQPAMPPSGPYHSNQMLPLRASSNPGIPSYPSPNPSPSSPVTSTTQAPLMPPSGYGHSSPELPPMTSGNVRGSISSPIQQYKPVHPHWFYCKEIEKRKVWIPFSLLDSVHLEDVFNSGIHDQESNIVPTDGGRYDVYLQDRMRSAVYWKEDPTPVRRCTWFYQGEAEKRFTPYEEHFSAKLEEEYRVAVTTNAWHRRLEFPGGETIIIHNPSVIVHFQPSCTPDEWGNVPEGQIRPRVVKRGVEDFDSLEDGEAIQIDHLVFVVHGIGGFCDLKFRTVTEVVDDFRSIANNLLHTHFKKHIEDGSIGRVEFLPISWHSTLHGDATGIDSQLQPITLKSIPKLRYFANDTILDVLFYTSPVHCQTILNQVGSEISRIHQLFLERNPSFGGNISLIGHSLGSVILFDILMHQMKDFNDSVSEENESSNKDSDPAESHDKTKEKGEKTESPDLEEVLTQLNLQEYMEIFQREKIDFESLVMCSENDMKDLGIPLGPRKKILSYIEEKKQQEKEMKKIAEKNIEKENESLKTLQRQKSMSTVNYLIGLAGTGQPIVSYPKFDFDISCFFALGSPVAMFLTVRGLQTVEKDFCLPTCPAFFNIFHPFDPVAYRFEPLVDPTFKLKPVLIPHHKGRKRMHLEIKESLSRVGSDLKQMLVESLRSTWNSINEFARAHKTNTAQVEAEIDKLAEEQMRQHEEYDDSSDNDSQTSSATSVVREEEIEIGKINQGHRIDYVLQEKPIESFNEYLFAIQSHTCYWESEDTVLMVLKEIYATLDIHPTSQAHEPSASIRSPLQVLKPMPTSTPVQSSLPPKPATGLPIHNFKHTMQPQASSFPVQNPPSYPPVRSPPSSNLGMDPTLPPTPSPAVAGPPPLSGFVRQSAIKKQ